jgi:hypothetical protein
MTKGPWLTYVILLVLIMLFTLSPVIALGILNAGNSGTPLQLTDLMASWGVLGWLVLTPIPVGAMALGAWLIALVVHLLVRRRQARQAKP